MDITVDDFIVSKEVFGGGSLTGCPHTGHAQVHHVGSEPVQAGFIMIKTERSSTLPFYDPNSLTRVQ